MRHIPAKGNRHPWCRQNRISEWHAHSKVHCFLTVRLLHHSQVWMHEQVWCALMSSRAIHSRGVTLVSGTLCCSQLVRVGVWPAACCTVPTSNAGCSRLGYRAQTPDQIGLCAPNDWATKQQCWTATLVTNTRTHAGRTRWLIVPNL